MVLQHFRIAMPAETYRYFKHSSLESLCFLSIKFLITERHCILGRHDQTSYVSLGFLGDRGFAPSTVVPRTTSDIRRRPLVRTWPPNIAHDFFQRLPRHFSSIKATMTFIGYDLPGKNNGSSNCRNS